MRMERQAGNRADSVTHETSAIVVLDGRTELTVLTMNVDMLTNRSTMRQEKENRGSSSKYIHHKAWAIYGKLPGKDVGLRMNCHGCHSLRGLNRVDRIWIACVHESHVSSQATQQKEHEPF